MGVKKMGNLINDVILENGNSEKPSLESGVSGKLKYLHLAQGNGYS